MDFVILKVNGQDVSNSSHEDAVRCFQSAQEPIIVEVLRRQPGQTIGGATSSNGTARNENEKCGVEEATVRRSVAGSVQPTASVESSSTNENERGGVVSNDNANHSKRNSAVANSNFPFVSTGVQTDWAGLVDEDELLPVPLNPEERTNDSFDDFLAQDMDFEEVTLRKTGSAEKLGLTVCYSSGSGSEDADTEVYISEIIPESLAARDGRLREGDQILRVNGKDVANKEQTENLFAETNNAVTILVSRCLYQDDEYDDRRLYIQGSPPMSPDNIPAYQNSMIEQLIRQQQQQQQPHLHQQQVEANNKENDSSSQPRSAAPPVPSHTSAPSVASAVLPPPPPPTLNSSSTCSSQNSQKSSKSASSPAHHGDDRKQWLQDALKECSKRIENVCMRGHQPCVNNATTTTTATSTTTTMTTVKLMEAYSSHVWSDTEHIYETIPESDNEPIYSSPYEHRQRQKQQHWNPSGVNSQSTARQCEQTHGRANWHSSSKSNSSGEEKDNSSSAYNTGESCHSNPLTLELHQAEKDHHRSTLVLCTPNNPPTTSQKLACSCPIPVAPSVKQQQQQQQQQHQSTGKIGQTARKNSSTNHHQHRERDSIGVVNASLPADTMYTNVANLEQTIILQQQLFKQALDRRNYTTRDTARKSKSHGNFQAPNLARYQFVGSQQVCTNNANSWNTPEDKGDVQMEWKVKRRPDGTRYIARRPVRSRVLRNRAIKISEERAGHTTEDDTMSEMKVGRYWTKEERKRQLERARERKQRQQELLIQQQLQLQQSINESPINEHNEDKSPKKPINIVELSYKKMARKKAALDDFTTVQEMLAHGNRVGGAGSGPGTGGKLMGLLSVTTV